MHICILYTTVVVTLWFNDIIFTTNISRYKVIHPTRGGSSGETETASPLKNKQLLLNNNYLKIIMYRNIFIWIENILYHFIFIYY
jgi:hypothetical protein